MIVTWSLALPILRFCPPRPPRRRLGTHPGTVACAAAILGLVMVAIDSMIGSVVSASNGGKTFSTALAGLTPWWTLAWESFGFRNGSGFAVAGAWLTLALARRWRPEPTWIDRAGRGIGIYWILMIPLYRLLEALMLFQIVTLN